MKNNTSSTNAADGPEPRPNPKKNHDRRIEEKCYGYDRDQEGIT